MTGHTIQVVQSYGGVDLHCSCGWIHEAGFTTTITELAEAELRHLLAAMRHPPSLDAMRIGATPEEVDAFMAAIGRGDSGWRQAPQTDGSVFWHWRCPQGGDGLHHGRIQYVTTDLGSTPVCLDCGNSGPVRSGPLSPVPS